ncbi:MAG: agmatinase [Acidobacteriota bacterium]
MAYQATSQPHTGIATFCKAPFQPDLDRLDADVAIVGIPYDEATAMRPGSRQAPRAIRDASTRFGFLGKGRESQGFFDIARDRQIMGGVRLVDTGDVDTVYFSHERNLDLVHRHLTAILDHEALPVVLGGDHSISYPVLRAFERFGPLTIVLVDAHLDYKLDIMGLRYTNNSPFRRAHDLPFVGRILNFGIRGIKSTDRDLRESREHGHLTFSSHQVHAEGVDALLEQCGDDLGSYYLSIDIDGLDPSIAPGTESPEAEGLTFTQVKTLAQGLARRGRLVGVDLVEVNPYLDPAELTQHIAAQLLIEVIATRFDG